MPIIDTQRRMRELGRIRIGQKSAKGAPQKLDRFRLTSASQALIEQVAAAYGGQTQPWHTPDGRNQFEVVTDATRIPILLPPQPVSQWMEHWSGGGCLRRCDGERETLTDQPCLCKANEQDLCKPTTRLNVLLRDLPGLGVWRLETHGWNAAQELPATALFAAQANGMIPAWLTLEERVSKSDGQTRRYMVPGIDVDVTPAQLLAGEGGIAQAAIEPTARPAIASAPERRTAADYMALADGCTTLDELTGLLRQAKGDGVDGPELMAHFLAVRQRIDIAAAPPASPPPVEDSDAARDRLWLQIVGATSFDSTAELEQDFRAVTGVDSGAATAGEMQSYLDQRQAVA